eukprot:scaffold330884_cov42-Prasinocladus_malaysianus.AAC.1
MRNCLTVGEHCTAFSFSVHNKTSMGDGRRLGQLAHTRQTDQHADHSTPFVSQSMAVMFYTVQLAHRKRPRHTTDQAKELNDDS